MTRKVKSSLSFSFQPRPCSHFINRGFHTTTYRLNEHIINIQDEEDFKDRVMKSVKPVVVDFHAEYVSFLRYLYSQFKTYGRKGSFTLPETDLGTDSDSDSYPIQK